MAPPDKKLGDLNPGQIDALSAALGKLKADGYSLLRKVEKGQKIPDFTVQETPSNRWEISDENRILRLRSMGTSLTQESPAAAKTAIEQATVHLSLDPNDAKHKNVLVEIQTPYGHMDHPSGNSRNFLVAHVNEIGELLDTPKVEVRDISDISKKR